MSGERKERCDKCKWWEVGMFLDGNRCFRYPPQITSSKAVASLPDSFFVSSFPITTANDFYSEFTPKDKPA